ncbi:ATP synthase subunit d, mitochondrial [Portunus trituberculatus]|uniref:ATP synthase subunit d, mitochondrial n=1 Tax=Portunus trituberculatus TaxID=210409 RepID=A0A5B7CJ10_PORTR|nr:ATP synthase subunit d, mitochondrial [Portunus trituberculatus]
MASRRVAASSVDWLTMASRVPETQKQMFNAFKGKSDGYLRSIGPYIFPQTVETETFIKESEGRIAKLQAELAEWQKMIPYDQMTMEEMVEAFPDKSVNVANPTLWPHTPEDQPGYVAKEGAEE